MIRLILFYACIILCSILVGQNHDYVWTFGYHGGGGHPDFRGTNLDFKLDTPTTFPILRDMWIGGTNASICDKKGNLLAFTNGMTVWGMNNEPLINGDSISPGEVFNDYYPKGYPIWYGAFFLPREKDSTFFLVHSGASYDGFFNNFHSIYTSIVDFSLLKGRGQIYRKNNLITSGKFEAVSACRHGNGNDWWILVPKNISFGNEKNLFLLSNDSINFSHQQKIGFRSLKPDSGGLKNGFSPDGSMYVQMDAFFGIQLFDFDRCTGELSNLRTHRFDHTDAWYAGNFEFSPNSRFLYFNSNSRIMQIDLWEEEFGNGQVDTVASYDGFIYENLWHATFNNQQLGPDGKIYISCSTTAPFLHVIHEPNKKGLACNVEQRAIKLAGYHRRSLPYFPNYRLGALNGVGCDSIVSNVQSEKGTKLNCKVYPNPTSGELTIEYENPLKEIGTFKLYDFMGKPLLSIDLSPNSRSQKLELSNHPSGIYFYKIESNNVIIDSGKLVVI